MWKWKLVTNACSLHLWKQAAKYKDPKDACAAIVAEAYRLWLQYETRTDDITIIVVHIDGLREVSMCFFPLPTSTRFLPSIFEKLFVVLDLEKLWPC